MEINGNMNSNPRLSYAIAAILSGSSIGPSYGATATDTSESESIQEITVTAQRRTENAQDVPISVQALTADTLSKLNVSTFEEFVKFVPNVTTATTGPGQSSIFFRGLSVGITGQQGTGTTGPIPIRSALLLLPHNLQQLPPLLTYGSAPPLRVERLVF